MPAAYSLDLRKKVIDAYNQKEGSLRSLAKRFKVSDEFVKGLVKRYKQTGSFEPLAHGGGNPGKIQAIHEEFLRRQLERQNDLTLEALSLKLKEQFGLKVSGVAVHETLKDLGISRKKKRFMIPKSMKSKIKKKLEPIRKK